MNGAAHTFSSALVREPEGRLFLWAVALAAVFVGSLAALSVWHPDGAALWSLAGVRLVAGRSGGLYTGFLMDIRFSLVIFINAAIEILWILLAAPVALLAGKRAAALPRVHGFVEKHRRSATRYRGSLRRSGSVGLLLFVMVPIPMSGPVVGALLGDFLEFSLGKTLALVVAGSCASLGVWTVVIYYFHDWVDRFGALAQWSVLGVFLAAGIGAFAVSRLRRARRA